MQFIKMHGIGNDYVYINGFTQPLPETDERLSDLARRISNRHFGVGGDGLILVVPPTENARQAGARVRMRMFNADGSESEMCGNGVRCVCKLAYDHQVTENIRDTNPMLIETGNGVLSLEYELDQQGKVAHVIVNMGRPILEPQKIPVRIESLAQIVNHRIGRLFEWSREESWIKDCGLDMRMTCVSMGNPHVVFYCRDVRKVPLGDIGPQVERHPIFPRRINVHFVQVHQRDEVTMRTWERGTGITLACGTGASAVCVAGALTDHTDRRIIAHLPGGDLKLEWPAADEHVYMTGPATEVFTGTWREP